MSRENHAVECRRIKRWARWASQALWIEEPSASQGGHRECLVQTRARGAQHHAGSSGRNVSIVSIPVNTPIVISPLKNMFGRNGLENGGGSGEMGAVERVIE